MDQGFNIIEDQELKKHGVNTCEELSIIQMFRSTKREDFEQWQDYCVKGLETLLIETENYYQLSDYLNTLLDQKVNFLDRKVNTFQIEVNTDKANIQEWEKPNIVPKSNEQKYSLFEIFNRIEMEEDNPNWYHSQLNINS